MLWWNICCVQLPTEDPTTWPFVCMPARGAASAWVLGTYLHSFLIL